MQTTLLSGQGKARVTCRDRRIDSFGLCLTITTGRTVFTRDNSPQFNIRSAKLPRPLEPAAGGPGAGRAWRGVAWQGGLQVGAGPTSPPCPARTKPSFPAPPGAVNLGRRGDGADPQKAPHPSPRGATWNPAPETAGIAAESATHARARRGPGPPPGPRPGPARLAPRLTPSYTKQQDAPREACTRPEYSRIP